MNTEFKKHRLPKTTARAALAACVLFAAGSVELCLAAASNQKTFESPDDASRALASAVQQRDEQAMREILGGGSELISSNDKVEDALDREQFCIRSIGKCTGWYAESGGNTTLYIGAENWPFPVPLVSHNGVWRFESKVGSEEIRFRRIGENEVTAIGMCATLAMAEAHPGTDSEADRLVKTLLPQVAGAGKPILFRGYYFHILSNAAGGFSAIAYPAMYRLSGSDDFYIASPRMTAWRKKTSARIPRISPQP